MSIPTRVTTYLKKAKVPFETVAHRTVFTAYDLAATLREKLENIGKTLLIKADGRYLLAMMPASRRLDLVKLKKLLGAKAVRIAKESDMERELKVKPGAITPFGSLHKLEVFADRSLMKARSVILGAGSFTESLRLKVKDFLKLENATLGAFTSAAKLTLPPPAKTKKASKRRPSRKPSTRRR